VETIAKQIVRSQGSERDTESEILNPESDEERTGFEHETEIDGSIQVMADYVQIIEDNVQRMDY